MDTPTPHPKPAPDGTQQFRGLLRVVNDLGTVTDNLFKRIYGSLSHRRKTLVDTEALRRAQAHARTLQRRARTQSMELARVTSVLALIEEGVVMQDPEGRIVLMNQAASQLLGGTRNFWDSPVGHLFKEYVTEAPDPTQAGLIEPFGEPERIEINNHSVGIRIARAYSDQSNLLGTVMILQDVTTDSLADRLKTSFITQMSHELLTPLTSIKGMSDVLLNLPEGRPPNRRFLEAIGRNVAILDRMVVELLDLSELGTESFDIRQDEFGLEDQLFAVVQGLEPKLRKAELSVSVMVVNADQLNILGDERRLQWAVGHIIENAIQYTLSGGEILIQIGAIRDDRVIIKIRDTGVGIADKDLPYIFDRMYRGEARTPDGKLIDPRGLGQGLYIAKEVTEAHGGEISVASVVGEGSTVTITLPLAPVSV
jgi:two-component system sensor histidine kinase ResE